MENSNANNLENLSFICWNGNKFVWVFQEEIREMNLRIKNADDERMSRVGDCIYSHIHTNLSTYIQSVLAT